MGRQLSWSPIFHSAQKTGKNMRETGQEEEGGGGGGEQIQKSEKDQVGRFSLKRKKNNPTF